VPQVVVEQNYGEAKRAIVKGLVAFNRAAVGKHAWKQIAVTVRDEGRIVGGALGACSSSFYGSARLFGAATSGRS
jgi:hypothetical protein